jgi:beta-lactamase class C
MNLLYLSSFTAWVGLFFGFFVKDAPTPNAEAHNSSAVHQEINPIKETFLADFDAEARKILRRVNQPGAAIAIVMDSTIVYTQGYGYRNKKTKELVNENSVFRIGSLSKGFASILSGALVTENEFSFEDKVIQHLPDFKLCDDKCTRDVQVKHILSHSCGYPYHAYTDMLEKGRSMDMIKEKLGHLNLIGKPGQYYSYGNVGYSLIEDVVENSTGISYVDQLNNKLFGPLKMYDASAEREDITSCDNVALPHYHSKRGWRPSRVSSKYYNATSAGGVNASIEDMSKWLQLLLGQHEEIISDEVLNQVFTPVVNAKNRKKYFQRWKGIKNAHYALGWRILDKKDSQGELVYHGGYVNQYRSEIAVSRKENIAICVLSNAPTAFASKCIPKFFELYESYKQDIELWNELNQATIHGDEKIQS